MVEKEEGIHDASDMLARIDGVHSFKYKYPVESWIWPIEAQGN